MGQVDMWKVSGDVVHQCGIGEEGSGGGVIGFTDGRHIMPGHGHRKVESSIWKTVTYNVKESGKPTM
jgi:hypothetical protein